MSNLIQTIQNKRKDILIGEIGALLHDIGKCYPDFVEKNSVNNVRTDFKHTSIDNFLNKDLVELLKNDILRIKICNEETNVYSLITKHHLKDDDLKSDQGKYLILLIKSCDRLDSADDKGIVRNKQSIENTIISSPFGFPKERIDLQFLQKKFECLQNNLICLFQEYVSGNLDITCFRKCLISYLKTTFSHSLGETRIPANDITLWDHSHSTASLYKSVLCTLVLGEYPSMEKLQWRIFGFCWDGFSFINRGRKIEDIIQRNYIIEEIKNGLKKRFEDEIPIGNAIYEDNNGIYFTFPALNGNESKELAKECARNGLEIIRSKSDNEIWPFFSLSKASRTLTMIAGELKFASEKRNIPKMTPTLFADKIEEEILSDNPEMPVPKEAEDICPVCRLKAKPEKSERCDVCERRRKGRLESWFSNRENTIWINEVADINNRVALLTLSFNLEKWLDGTMVGTIYSQSFEDWQTKWKNIQNISIEANKDSVYQVLDEILKLKDSNKKRAAQLLDTFFEDISINSSNLVQHLSNIEERIGTGNLTKENLAAYLFTKNASPARLYRIWQETKEFFDLVISEIKSQLYSHKWKRLSFKINISNFKPKENTPYIIKIKELKPENLLVLHTVNGQFYTIESLEKFKFKETSGVNAVQDALKNEGFYWIAEEDEQSKNLLQNGLNVKTDEINIDNYYPFIEITKSPLLIRLIVSALDSIKIIELASRLYAQRFEKVIGKLPLNVGLFVSKRKFPLYVLLDAGERLFHTDEFEKPEEMDVWWNIDGISNDKYYGFYPQKSNQIYILDNLVPISKNKSYALYPGYFDFDLLLGTTDRYNITYRGKSRSGKDYNLYTNRPYYFHQISLMIKLWEILKNNLSSSQIHFVEENLTNKLREWRDIDDSNKKDVFRKYAEAILKDAFVNSWEKIRKETQDFLINSILNRLLLDTIILFRHIIKEKEV